jgi:hypothetical protein
MDPIELLIGLAITAVFVIPALAWPRVGRAIVGLFFIAGALVNSFFTLPMLPGSLEALVATAPIAIYHNVVRAAVEWRLDALLVALVIVFELTVGVLMFWRGPLVSLGLFGAAAWGLGMLPVVPPYALPVGIALTAAPSVAALILASRQHNDSVVRSAWLFGISRGARQRARHAESATRPA